MTDDKLRKLERKWNATGNVEDAIAYAQECNRFGQPLDGKRALNKFVRNNRTNSAAVAQAAMFDPLCYTGVIALSTRGRTSSLTVIEPLLPVRIIYGEQIDGMQMRAYNLTYANGKLHVTFAHNQVRRVTQISEEIVQTSVPLSHGEYLMANSLDEKIVALRSRDEQGRVPLNGLCCKITDAEYCYKEDESYNYRPWRQYKGQNELIPGFDTMFIENLTVFTKMNDAWTRQMQEEDRISHPDDNDSASLLNFDSFNIGTIATIPLHCRYAQDKNYAMHPKELFSVITAMFDHPITTVQEIPLNTLDGLRKIHEQQIQ